MITISGWFYYPWSNLAAGTVLQNLIVNCLVLNRWSQIHRFSLERSLLINSVINTNLNWFKFHGSLVWSQFSLLPQLASKVVKSDSKKYSSVWIWNRFCISIGFVIFFYSTFSSRKKNIRMNIYRKKRRSNKGVTLISLKIHFAKMKIRCS
jgi:hypothetical protein